MKQILWSCAGLLLALLALLGGFRLFYDFEYHKIRPLCGEWCSTLNDTRLEIVHQDDGFWIRIHRCDPRTGRESFEMHPMKYASCIHYTTYGGARVDLFHTPGSDLLLVIPGGIFKRDLSNLQNNLP